ncbi:MAG: glycoside hydrolase family 28 protein [Firmicutes bacterium]|nr:glycoside hydrolase family 28 protein [Bacillota bacterium]
MSLTPAFLGELPLHPTSVNMSLADAGGLGDGHFDNTEVFREAIQYCFDRGGGTVVVPQGIWHTGPIHLKSNVRLHLEAGAVIDFDTAFERYLPLVFTRWEGVECYNYSPLIYAYQASQLAITGQGEIRGNGAAWWPWKQTQGEAAHKLYDAEAMGIPVAERRFGIVGGLRPPLLQFVDCANILIDGVTFRDGPQWTIHPVYCENVLIRNVVIHTRGPNTDGINPDSCRNVWIEDCEFSTGDDCIAINSGMNEDGWRVNRPSEHIYIQRCKMVNGHAGIAIGSGMSGGVKDIHVSQCTFRDLERGIRLKSIRGRGGIVEDVNISDIQMDNIEREGLTITAFYDASTVPPRSHSAPLFTRITFVNIRGRKAQTGIALYGLEDMPISDVRFKDIHFDHLQRGMIGDNVRHLSFENVTLLVEGEDNNVEVNKTHG